MAFFSSDTLAQWFKPKWQHPDPAVRRQGLSALKTTEEKLAFIAQEPEADLRQTVLATITDHTTLTELRQSAHRDVQEYARTTLLAAYLDAHCPTGANQHTHALSNINDDDTLLAIAELTEDNALRLAAINQLSDTDKRLDIAKNHPSAQVRQAAAQGITSETSLHQLQRHAKGKDNAIYKLCKDRLSEIKAQQHALAATQARIDELIELTQRLSKTGYTPDFSAKLQQYQHAFEPLTTQASDEQQTLWQQACEHASSILDEHQQQEQAHREREEQKALAHTQQKDCLTTLEALLEQDATTDTHEALSKLEHEWQQANRTHPAIAEHKKRFEQCWQQLTQRQHTQQIYNEQRDHIDAWLQRTPNSLSAIEQHIKEGTQLIKTLRWPDNDPAPAWLNDITHTLDTSQQALRNMQQQSNDHDTHIRQQLPQIEQLINDGKLQAARKQLSHVQGLMTKLNHKQAKTHQGKLKSLQAQLAQLNDWQGFAAQPKKEALCKDMEALIDAELPPQLLAEKIHDLQMQWKTLGPIPNEKPLWERFQQAGDRAFEPCKSYFANEHAIKKQRVSQRDALTEQLRHYNADMDWDNANWRVVEKTLRTAQQAFKALSPVDHSAHKRTQAAFQDVTQAIYQRLKDEYERNINAKQALIERAKDNVTNDDLSSAIDNIKQLQQSWKSIGIIPHQKNQTLWHAFRTQCDAVFNRLDQAKAERKEHIEHTISRAQDALSQARAVIDSDQPIRERQNQLSELKRSALEAELPKGVQHNIRSDFQALEKRLAEQLDAEKVAKEEQRWQGIMNRLAVLHDGTHDERWTEHAQLPNEFNAELFEQALAKKDTRPQDDDTSTQLCIAIEVLADLPSPEQEQALRMEYQVTRLAQGMGQLISHDSERADIVHRWIEHRHTDAHHTRFENALRASLHVKH